MKKILTSIIVACLGFCYACAQEPQIMDDAARIALSIYMSPSSSLPNKARAMMTDKLQKIVTKSGLGATTNGRFIITANVRELNLEKSETAPVIYIYNLEVNMYMGDGIDGTLFSNCSVEVSGAGDSSEKAYMAAIKKLKVSDPQYQLFIDEGKRRIVEYYNTQCDFIMKEAMSMADRKEFDEAIYHLLSVPSVCKECYDKVQDASVQIYKRKIENDCQLNLSQAKAAIAANDWDGAIGFLALYTPDLDCYPEVAKLMKDIQDHRCADALARAQAAWANRNAYEAADWLAEVSADSKCYPDAQKLQSEIAKKLDADEKREWDFKLKQQKDATDIEKAAIKATRDIGVAYGNHQQPITYNIRTWW